MLLRIISTLDTKSLFMVCQYLQVLGAVGILEVLDQTMVPVLYWSLVGSLWEISRSCNNTNTFLMKINVEFFKLINIWQVAEIKHKLIKQLKSDFLNSLHFHYVKKIWHMVARLRSVFRWPLWHVIYLENLPIGSDFN